MSEHSQRSIATSDAQVVVVEDYRAAWRRDARPELESFWAARPESRSRDAIAILAALIKEELGARFARGERPTVADYLERFPQLRQTHERMISLIYEEFCLCEEAGARPDPEQFCDRYEPWRDSLLSQLRYHDAFSQLATAKAAAPPFPEPGEYFLKFRLCSELGRGGAGRVYLARDENLGGKKFALKVSADQGHEPSIQGQLDHPHIVPVNHVELEPETGLRGLCMPYWPGLTLDKVVRSIDPARTRPRHAGALLESLKHITNDERDPQDLESFSRAAWADFPRHGTYADAIAWVALKMAEALAHAHKRGIVHRDIKPANVLLTRRGGPLLLDFNLAQGPADAEEAVQASRGGTLPYMAPEHLRAFLNPDCWDEVGSPSDLFSLGLVMRELLTGQAPPFAQDRSSPARRVAEQLDLRLSGPLPAARTVNRGVPHALDAIITKCQAFDPDDRYRTASDLADDLRMFLERRPLRHAVNPSRRERVSFFLSRNRQLARTAILGCAISGALLMGAYHFSPILSPPVISNTPEELETLAKACLKSKDFEGALRHYKQAQALDPSSIVYAHALGTILNGLNRFSESVQWFETALGLAESSPAATDTTCADLRLNLATVRNRQGEALLTRAVEASTKTDEQSRQDFRALARQADIHFEQALQELDRARALDAEVPPGREESLRAKAFGGRGTIALLDNDSTRSTGYFRDAHHWATEAGIQYNILDDQHMLEDTRKLIEWLNERLASQADQGTTRSHK